MVKLTSIFFSAALVVSVLANPLVGRGLPELQADFTTIKSQATALEARITRYPNSTGSLADARAIHTATVNLDNTIKKTTGCVAQSTAAIAGVEDFEPVIIKALRELINKKQSFVRNGSTATVKSDLTSFADNCAKLGGALVGITHPSKQQQAQAAYGRFETAFDAAIAAYS
ncbi:hypothetical protein BDV98DRAFT_598485 [Pterulicium gracile]|uniref:Hydrophobic surface binding protein A-domain-containing protein n=1 Tax=Pterulicium gracile TaxID=1884261 RepID=A0A5C3QAR0_9AGAR|nr:hypothetical protein BDV98DRAFT_598485 [Pterula gracilis]